MSLTPRPFALAGVIVLSITPFVAGAGTPAGDVIEELRVEAEHVAVDAAEDAAARIPGGVTVVDLNDVEERAVANLADMLRYVPGVWAASGTGADSVFFSSRGSNLDATDYDGNGVKLLQDGLPVTTADGNNHNRIVDPLAMQYATVARGANALTYGASTLGGAINFVSPTAHDQQGVELRVTGGSNGLQTARATAAREFSDTLDGLLTIEGKSWDGYREHNDQSREGVYGNLGWRVSDSVASRFFAAYVSNDQELPGSLTRAQVDADPDAANSNAVAGNYQLNVDTMRIANTTTWELGTGRIDAGVSYESQTLFHPIVEVLVDFDGPGPLPPTSVFSLLIDTDHDNTGAMVRYSRDAGEHALAFGINYGRSDVSGQHYRHVGGRKTAAVTAVDNEAESFELFALDRWHISDVLHVDLALQGVFAERQAESVDLASSSRTAPQENYRALNHAWAPYGRCVKR
ncbi:MAG: TonB-dependent receptor plug domain-containing protein [Gammaproteobacteria bacterium]|nr:TonB-dependent receptor plug domain-containing protein [Gammaproteobacteria bacterium]